MFLIVFKQFRLILWPVIKPVEYPRCDYRANHPVYLLFRHCAGIEQFLHFLPFPPVSGKDCVLSTVYHFTGIICPAPVGHDAAPETQIAAEQGVDDIRTLARPFAVDKIVACHNIACPCIYTCLERCHIHFVQRTFVNQGVCPLTVQFTFVAHKMLHAGSRTC